MLMQCGGGPGGGMGMCVGGCQRDIGTQMEGRGQFVGVSAFPWWVLEIKLRPSDLCGKTLTADLSYQPSSLLPPAGDRVSLQRSG